jgi:hypothetical protein
MDTTINNDQEAYMDKSDPGVFESGVATLDTLGTTRNTSRTVVGTPAGYRIRFLPTKYGLLLVSCFASSANEIRRVSYKGTS